MSSCSRSLRGGGQGVGVDGATILQSLLPERSAPCQLPLLPQLLPELYVLLQSESARWWAGRRGDGATVL